MLTVQSKDDSHNTCFKFIGADTTPKTTHLISNNTSLIAPTVGDGTDTCSFYSGPSDAAIVAFGQSMETAGSIAYISGETAGSIAYSGGETAGSIASSFSSGAGFSAGGSSFSGGGCSYSC